MATTFGQRILALRRLRGLKQEELAARAQVSASFLSRIERDIYREPRRPYLVRIARALGVTPEELIGETPATPATAITVSTPNADLLGRFDRFTRETLVKLDRIGEIIDETGPQPEAW